MAGLEFDGQINHILGKLEIETKTDVINELALDVENEVLQELRERVFLLAKASYESKLRDLDELEKGDKLELTLQKRKAGDNEPIAKDIVDLYEYTVELSTTFPRDVLTRGCRGKLKDVTGKENKAQDKDQVQQWKELFSGKSKEVIHQRIFNTEVKNLVKELEKKVDALVQNSLKDRKKIEDLEHHLTDANKKIAELSATGNQEKEIEITHIEPSQAETVAHTTDNTNSKEPTKEQQTEQPPETKVQCQVCTYQPPPPPPLPPLQKSPTSATRSAMVTTVRGENGAATTYLHRAGTTGSLPLEQHRKDQRNQRLNNPTNKRQLFGARKEKHVNMYLSGIMIEGDETDEDIVQIVKEHLWDKGIRLMGHRVVRTKRYPYVVGCKIMVPESQEYIALNPHTWPSDIVCRKWEPAWRHKGYESYEGYRNQYYGNDDY